ncbi:cAAX amino terminal protease family protein [Firmicutes bacterium CAG:582]|nr:cAAX amino terminal protease family protein [Firmicutes bacterium CAG:582]
MNSLISFFKSIGLLLIVSFIMAVFSILTKNQAVAYFFTYFTSSFIFLFIYKDKLKNDLKNIRNDLNTKNIIIIVLFLVLSFISNIILVNMLNQEASNQEIAVSMLKSFSLLGIPAICLFAPFVEEIIYRLPYKKNWLSIIISTIVFTFAHISNFSLIQMFFLIPYLFLSISFSFAYFKNENIILSTTTHILNNLISVVLLLI